MSTYLNRVCVMAIWSQNQFMSRMHVWDLTKVSDTSESWGYAFNGNSYIKLHFLFKNYTRWRKERKTTLELFCTNWWMLQKSTWKIQNVRPWFSIVPLSRVLTLASVCLHSLSKCKLIKGLIQRQNYIYFEV